MRTTPPGTRRDQLVAVAADLLREGGPDALTTVAVAARCGITQPAVYRHVPNIETLTARASAIVLQELQDGLARMVEVSDVDVDSPAAALALAGRIVDTMAHFATAYEIVDRWRFADGPLGEGIGEVLAAGRDITAFALELRWRQETGISAPLDDRALAVQLTHASLIRDESHAVARMVRDPACPLDRDSIVRLLSNRFEAGWAAYRTDMTRTCSANAPVADAPTAP